MKEELKVIYNKIIKPVGKGSISCLISPLTIVPSIKKFYQWEEKHDIDMPGLHAGMVTMLLIFPPIISTSTAKIFLERGYYKEALIWGIPLATNIISAGYVLGKCIWNYAKEQAGTLPAPKKPNKLEKELTNSKATNLKSAVEHLTFEDDGSLHTNGNLDEEKKRKEYADIIKQIGYKGLTAIRMNFEDALPSLKISEEVNPGKIKTYFKEKFGVPIESYQDANMFYGCLIDRETKKPKNPVARMLKRRIPT